MKRIDINQKYRAVAIYCAVHGGRSNASQRGSPPKG